MKINKNLRNIFKIAFIGFIIISCIYVLYFFNNEYKIIENFAGSKDCSNCKMKPGLNCKPIYDISYNGVVWNSSKKEMTIDICNIMTDYVFCEWEPNCANNELIDNILSQDERQSLTNTQLQNKYGEYDITCCSGSDFYNTNILDYSIIADNTENKLTCANLILDISNTYPSNYENKDKTLNALYNNFEYRKTKSICDTLDIGNSMKGMLFQKSESNSDIFKDPKSLPKDILDYISFSNIRNSLSTENKDKLEQEITKLENLNRALFDMARVLQRPIKISDLNATQLRDFTAIKTSLAVLFNTSNIVLQQRKDISYTLVQNATTKNSNGRFNYPAKTKSAIDTSTYLLNSDQFFNCFGNVMTDNSGTFSQAMLADFSNNDYFGDASLNAYEIQPTLYPNNKDLEMELRRLETIPSSGNAPVSVISTYLNAINSFYDKQVQNLTGPRDHTFNQELVFDNNTLETKTPTFFTYDKDENNKYECIDSITGESAFKYCGPSAYSNTPRF